MAAAYSHTDLGQSVWEHSDLFFRKEALFFSKEASFCVVPYSLKGWCAPHLFLDIVLKFHFPGMYRYKVLYMHDKKLIEIDLIVRKKLRANLLRRV